MVLPLALAAMSFLQSNQQRQNDFKQAEANNEANRFSTWNNKRYDVQASNQNPFGAALQGGMGGLAQEQAIAKEGGWGKLFGNAEEAQGAIAGPTTQVQSAYSRLGNYPVRG